MSDEPSKSTFKWRQPSEVMQLQKLKQKKKALQARINSTATQSSNTKSTFNNILSSVKRKNPFIKSGEAKRSKCEAVEPEPVEISSDNTLFQLLHLGTPSNSETNKENLVTSFSNVFKQIEEPIQVKSTGEKWIPIDWSLKRKVRFLANKPFGWSQKLKISEEASGVTSFTRCLDTSTSTTLDTSSNSKFHQCCMYWQQPSIPWINLFPRSNTKATQSTIPLTAAIKESMQNAWMDSLRSLFHLIRTRQCPYFYACANSFTVLFRAAGIGGFSEIHAMVAPTTRGFRAALRQEEIEFTMPLMEMELKKKPEMKQEEDEEQADEKWLQSMGINKEDIKQINYTQEKITQKAECEIDNSDLSLILIQGVEVQGFYSFLVHCKSAVSPTGLFAGIPPTLLAPVAFHGAALTPLQVRESKVHVDNEDFYSLDITGPILPHSIHNLCALHSKENSMTATFSTLDDTVSFSRINTENAKLETADDTKDHPTPNPTGMGIFNEENLRDCGLVPQVLKHFCSADTKIVNHVECLKYTAETNSYAWT
ncbi:protein downstream neighbor of son homolog [Atheta coriaria]|uniref:protein downstream neighbor of son homolog n=1 Tax=Dalotia coriaria TaxID=877792 RepID=UPI0031F3F9DA